MTRKNPPSARQIFIRSVIWKWRTNYGIARKLWDRMLSEKIKPSIARRFFWENNAINTPVYHPHNPRARRIERRYCASLVAMLDTPKPEVVYDDTVCGWCANTDPACAHYKPE